MVECENGAKFYTDHVVCTVPLGVVKEKKDLFVPPLPQEKREAMEKLNFGTVDKIFLEYERPFLSPDISEVVNFPSFPHLHIHMAIKMENLKVQ